MLAALINHFGIRLASLVNDFSVIAEILGTVVIGFFLLGIALVHRVHLVSYLLSHLALPSGMAYLGAFLASSLMSVWTLGANAIFTMLGQVEVVIMAICTFAMYATYGMVVAAVLWGTNQRMDLRDVLERKKVSRGLCIAALLWIAGIIGLLVFMTAITMSHPAVIETVIGAGLLGLIAVFYTWLRRKNKRSVALQLAEEE